MDNETYADRDAEFVAGSYAWQHTFSEILGVLAKRGLVVESLREYPVITWKAFEFMVEDGDGMWRLPEGAGDIPLVFGLTVRRPGDRRPRAEGRELDHSVSQVQRLGT